MSEGRKGFYIPGWGTTTYTAWDKKAKQKNLSGERAGDLSAKCMPSTTV